MTVTHLVTARLQTPYFQRLERNQPAISAFDATAVAEIPHTAAETGL
jgi:hypothetical protein